ncbi:conserved hypothetical protein [Neospora caninum Liverpool]|uniref:Transmembrane protein n=1 Tax=Neospora caninum (strain Liverpool) TaxID=572307 RepID=F0VBU3_NEOCL|nr:conserved hypothetical protein [Neospora caninum Liverpool]CBZ51077.1 conserved hypothetical protein [Neospora caninum Liverpool]CEL68384.1 TPA: hypothetical protein BN1204_041530 [Neospora caninum Liverpool]|eukprot:XP_003881110.1 conserved hypothetical protein [Neospora caninum Liverpool]
MSRRSSPLTAAVSPRESRRTRDAELESLSTCDDEHRNSLLWDGMQPSSASLRLSSATQAPTKREKMRRKSGSAAGLSSTLLASADPRDHVYGTCPGGRTAVNAAVRELSRLEDARRVAYETYCQERYERSQDAAKGRRPSGVVSLLGFLFLAFFYFAWLLDVQTETMLPVLGSIGQVLSLPSFLFHFLLECERNLSSRLSFSKRGHDTQTPAEAPALSQIAAGTTEGATVERRFRFLSDDALFSGGETEFAPPGDLEKARTVLKPWLPLIRQLDALPGVKEASERENKRGQGKETEPFLFRPRLRRRSNATQTASAMQSASPGRDDKEGQTREDLKAFGDLQRSCGVPYLEDAAFVLPEETPRSAPLLRLPRDMLLSSRDAPLAFRKRCKVPLAGSSSAVRAASRACTANELLGLLLVREKQLQRDVMKEVFLTRVSEVKDWDRLRSQLPPLPFCLVKPTKNALFFDDAHWEALEFLSLLQKKPLDLFLAGLSHAALETGIFPQRSRESQDADDTASQREKARKEETDIRDAVSVLYSKGLWDLDNNVAVAPAAFELQGHFNRYTWNSDDAMMHEATEQSFSWSARHDLPSGSQILVNQGQLSNLHTLHRFGIVDGSNPWGPVFLFRRVDSEGFGVSPPYASSRHAQGVALPGEMLFARTRENFQKLPSWMLRKRVVPRDGTMCFHPAYKADQNAHYSCPPVADAVETSEETETAEEPPELDRPTARQTQTSSGHEAIVCEASVFFNRSFGFGSLVLHRRGPIGGFDKLSYQCLRELLSSSPPASSRQKGARKAESVRAGEALGDEVELEAEDLEEAEGLSLATKERMTAALLKEACFLQLESTQQGIWRLTERQRKEEREAVGEEARAQPSGGAGRAASQEKERRTRRGLTALMLQAAKSDEELLHRCVGYFARLEKRAKIWEQARAEF